LGDGDSQIAVTRWGRVWMELLRIVLANGMVLDPAVKLASVLGVTAESI